MPDTRYIIINGPKQGIQDIPGYFYSQLSELKADPQARAQKEVASLVAKVSQLIVLPENETPTVATVSDVEALSAQPFFAKASNGDKVLIYTSAKKAILYNPEMNKVVEIAPVNIGNNQGAGSATPATPAPTPTPDEQ